jgi:type IV secretion system protein VirB9
MAQRFVLGGLVLLFWGLTVALLLVLLGGCTQEPPPPPVPPPLEDLSLWSVPELVQPPPEEPKALVLLDKETPAEQVLTYAPGTTFTLSVPVGAPLDIIMGHNEQVRNIIGGDRQPVEANQTTRWEIKEGADGLGDTLRQHIFLTVTTPGLTTGLIITSTLRTYYLTLKSVAKSPFRAVRWRYPVDTHAVQAVKEPGLLPDPAQPKQYHVGYVLQGTKPEWQPRYILDDGKKTYIIFPEITLFATVPMLRLIGPNGPQLVNSRQFLNVVIVDQLIPRAELRVGIGEHAETVTITRGALHTIACPGDQECPVWPAAAQVLAQRHPPQQPPTPAAPPPVPMRQVPPTPVPAAPPAPPPQAGVVPIPPQGDTP